MRSARLTAIGFTLGAACWVIACGSGGEGAAATAGGLAFTVADGDKFVVSATPEHVVLAKRVGAAALPFDAAGVAGKAILIHPVAGRADNGVYARVVHVVDTGTRFELETTPLTLAEMDAMTEDEIVRIYLTTPRAARPVTGTLRPSWFTVVPATSDYDFNTYAGLTGSDLLTPGVSVHHVIEVAALAPNILFGWDRARGLELGFRASLTWRSTLAITGDVGGDFFRSPAIETPPFVTTVPIGIVPVPITLSAAALISCSALVRGPVEAKVHVSLDASIGGSVVVEPSAIPGAEGWFSEGQWPFAASGTATVTGDTEAVGSAGAGCAVPRLELRALVAGVAGPFLAVTPLVSIASGRPPSFTMTLSAGVRGRLFGTTQSLDVPIYTWHP